MGAWTLIPFSLLRSVCVLEMSMGLSGPVLYVTVPSSGFALKSYPVKWKPTPVSGTPVLNLKQTSKFKKIAIQPRQTSILPFFMRSYLAFLSSRTLPRESSCLMNILHSWNGGLHDPLRRRRCSDLVYWFSTEFLPNHIFPRRQSENVFGPCPYSTVKAQSLLHIVHFELRDALAQFNSCKDR